MIISVYFVFSVVTCNNTAVDNTTRNPTTDTVNANTDVNYTCNDGYSHTGGDLNRICTGSGQLTGLPPICTRKLTSTFYEF